MSGPLEIVEGGGPVCVDGVCWPAAAEAVSDPVADLSDGLSATTDTNTDALDSQSL